LAQSRSEGQPGRSHHPLADQATATEDGALRGRRQAIAELGDALRELVQCAAATEAPGHVLRAVAAQARAAAAALRAERQRTRMQTPGADDLPGGYRNPVTGSGNALAPPLVIEAADDLVIGTCTLGLAYEGPPAFGHGGVSAMLLDQLLGYAVSRSGRPGMTVKLEVRYRAPVPLQAPLRLTAHISEVRGRRVSAQGLIATAAEPDKALVEASGTFIELRTDQAARLFGKVRPDATDPQVAHD
jgi:acyl-CoA thioesterase FadM